MARVHRCVPYRVVSLPSRHAFLGVCLSGNCSRFGTPCVVRVLSEVQRLHWGPVHEVGLYTEAAGSC